jgi:hypothetical protein
MVNALQLMNLFHGAEWVFLEKPRIVQPLENFPTCYGTRRFVAMFTRALHWFLFWARWNQSIPSHAISLRFILVVSFHLRLGFPSGLFPSDFPTKIPWWMFFLLKFAHLLKIPDSNSTKLPPARMYTPTPIYFFYSCYSHLEHRASIGLLGRRYSPSQGHCRTQTQNKHRHPCLEWDSNPRSQCSSGRRHFMS